MSQKNNKKAQEDTPGTNQISEKQKKWIKGAIFFAVILGLFIVNNLDGEPDNGPYPPFYQETNSPTLRLSEFKGKAVIIDFWATWCLPCRKGVPDFVELKKEYAGKDLEIIGISLDELESKQTVEDFIKEFNVNYPIVWGNQSVQYRYGGIKSIPTTFVLDKEGNIVSQYVGYTTKDIFVRDIEKILAVSESKKETVQAPDFELPLINKISL